MSEVHRLFFALWPDDATRAALADAAREVRQRHHPGGRITSVERLHVTLQFLGAFPVWPADIATRAAAAAAQIATEAFAFDIDRAASFGTRVWWIGPSDPPPALHRLHVRLRESLRRNVVPYERGERFTPHVTVVRDADRVLAPSPIAPLRWAPADFVLAASGPPDAAYRIVERWPLPRGGEADAPVQAGLWDR